MIGKPEASLPVQPKKPNRVDYEYRRNGATYLHMAYEPLAGQRQVLVTQQHTHQEFAQCMQWLVNEIYPTAETIRVVLDNLATHKPAALYETFPPEEARRI